MSNAVAIREIQPVATRRDDLCSSLAEIERVAASCARSGYFKDVRDASQAVVKMLAGREMGIGPIAALSSIHVVEGRPTAGASLLAAMVKRSGRYDYRVVTRSDAECVLEWFDAGKSVGMSGFNVDDAKRAGLWGKANWNKYPRAMLFARALTEGLRVFAPDAAGGALYTPEELRPDAVADEDGVIVEAAPIPRIEIAQTPSDHEAKLVNPPPRDPRTEPGVITQAQGKRLWAMAAERAKALDGVDRADIVRDALGRRGIEHTTDVPRVAYDHICHDVEAWEPPVATADAIEHECDSPGGGEGEAF